MKHLKSIQFIGIKCTFFIWCQIRRIHDILHLLLRIVQTNGRLSIGLLLYYVFTFNWLQNGIFLRKWGDDSSQICNDDSHLNGVMIHHNCRDDDSHFNEVMIHHNCDDDSPLFRHKIIKNNQVTVSYIKKIIRVNCGGYAFEKFNIRNSINYFKIHGLPLSIAPDDTFTMWVDGCIGIF